MNEAASKSTHQERQKIKEGEKRMNANIHFKNKNR